MFFVLNRVDNPENRIDGSVKFSRVWLIPKDIKKPTDGRLKKVNDNE